MYIKTEHPLRRHIWAMNAMTTDVWRRVRHLSERVVEESMEKMAHFDPPLPKVSRVTSENMNSDVEATDSDQ